MVSLVLEQLLVAEPFIHPTAVRPFEPTVPEPVVVVKSLQLLLRLVNMPTLLHPVQKAAADTGCTSCKSGAVTKLLQLPANSTPVELVTVNDVGIM